MSCDVLVHGGGTQDRWYTAIAKNSSYVTMRVSKIASKQLSIQDVGMHVLQGVQLRKESVCFLAAPNFPHPSTRVVVWK